MKPSDAIRLQKQLAARLILQPLKKPARFIAGLDAAFSPDGSQCIAGVVHWDLQKRKVIEQHWTARPLRFPYVPGLLSFREAPALLAVLEQLNQPPDLLMCDGQGIAHPRRLGIASHVGLWCGLPSIGCAKSRLIGVHREPGTRRGNQTALMDRGERIGTVLRTRDQTKPLFVSPGHLIDILQANRLVLRCAIQYRLPEPTRLADRLVAAARKEIS